MAWNDECEEAKALALNKFQNCNITNEVKNMVCSIRPMPLSLFLYTTSMANNAAKKHRPMPMMPRAMPLVMMKSESRRGLSAITSAEGGNDASARAAKVSMMRLTHNICVTVRGRSVPIIAPPSTSSNAVTLTISWKYKKRWMLR